MSIQKQAKLPNVLRPRVFELARYGRKNDGGYLIPAADLDKSDVLLSFGLNDDWSFERDANKHHDLKIYCYDRSVTHKSLLKMLLKNILHFPSIGPFLNTFYSLITFRIFFSKPNVDFLPYFVGRCISKKSLLFSQVWRQHDIKGCVYLKIDIEGSEYRILEDIVLHRENITGIAIEFHDFDLHVSQITFFVEKMEMHVAHVHVNNYGEIDDEASPNYIELVLSRSEPASSSYANLPHILDNPNNAREPEVEITFHDF